MHGHGDDWEVLKQILAELGIEEVDEFNGEQVIGRTVVSRRQEMAGQARFAFALLTRDDRSQDRKWLPRLNVAHEIGLCHARLGLESTAILREPGVTIFLNLQGVVYLDYDPGKLRNKKKQIAAQDQRGPHHHRCRQSTNVRFVTFDADRCAANHLVSKLQRAVGLFFHRAGVYFLVTLRKR